MPTRMADSPIPLQQPLRNQPHSDMSRRQSARFAKNGPNRSNPFASPASISKRLSEEGLNPREFLDQRRKSRQTNPASAGRMPPPRQIDTSGMIEDEEDRYLSLGRPMKRKEMSPNADDQSYKRIRDRRMSIADDTAQDDEETENTEPPLEFSSNKSSKSSSASNTLSVVLRLNGDLLQGNRPNQLRLSNLIKKSFPTVSIKQLKLLKDSKSFLVIPATHESSRILLDEQNWPDDFKSELSLKPPPKHGHDSERHVEYDIVAKRIDPSITEEEIKQELLEQEFKSVVAVKRFTRKLGEIIEETPSVRITVTSLQELNQLYKFGLRLGFSHFQTEAPRNNLRPVQCFKCHGFNHFANECQYSTKCRLCGSEKCVSVFDKSSPCPAEADRTMVRCANCGENHSAKYKGCPYYKEMIIFVNEEDSIAKEKREQKLIETRAGIDPKISYAAAASSHPAKTHQYQYDPSPIIAQLSSINNEFQMYKESVVQFVFNALVLSTAEDLLTEEAKKRLKGCAHVFNPEKVKKVIEKLALTDLGIKADGGKLMDGLSKAKQQFQRKPSTAALNKTTDPPAASSQHNEWAWEKSGEDLSYCVSNKNGSNGYKA